jgi:hypothetical protein
MADSADDRLADWFMWFKENVDRGRDYDKEKEFLHTALRGLMECVIILRAQQRQMAPPKEAFLPRLIHIP